MENKSNSSVVTLTPITESSNLTIQSDHTDMEKQGRTFPEEDKLFERAEKKTDSGAKIADFKKTEPKMSNGIEFYTVTPKISLIRYMCFWTDFFPWGI